MTNPFDVKVQPTLTAANPFLTGAKPQNAGSVAFGSGGFSSGGFGKASFNSAGFGSAGSGSTSTGKAQEATKPAKNPFAAAGESDTKRKGRGFQDRDASASESEGSKRKTRGDGARGPKKLNGQTKPASNGLNGAVAAATGKPTQPGVARQNKANSTTGGFGASSTSNTKVPAFLLNSKDPFARKVYTQLHKDGIGPPSWPSQPGDPKNKATMAKFREQYEEYRAKVRTSLTNAGLIDDPNKRRRLDEAIDFRGICEDMCPEYEKITRITEFDVVQAEKDPDTKLAITNIMVKKLARSAAGQEAPLPMDVRSVPSLRRTLDYLIDDLLHDDDNLPLLHGFLWDRTRAIRRDFTFFSSLSPDELKTQVYVLETIARFHVTSLHLLSQDDLTPEDFVEQQEKEQLGKALLSLRDLYDDCNVQGITCENEAEFRAYYLLFHAPDPNIMEVLQRQWKPWLWKESDEVRTAVSLVEALQNTRDFYGPLKPAPTLAAAGPLHAYFRIVEDPAVSYTMACFAEIHFASLRSSVLSALAGALARPKIETKDVTANSLNDFLRFDTVDQAIAFAEKAGLDFADDPQHPGDENYVHLVLQHKQPVDRVKPSHQFSENLVEKKRGNRTLPNVIHSTVSDAAGGFAPTPASKSTSNLANEGSLFVDGNETKKPPTSTFPSQNGFSKGPTSWSSFATPNAATQPTQANPSLFSNPSAPAQSAQGFAFPSTTPSTVLQPAATNLLGAPKTGDLLFRPASFAADAGAAPEPAKPSPFSSGTTAKTSVNQQPQNGLFPPAAPAIGSQSATSLSPATKPPSLFDTKPSPFSVPAAPSPFSFPPATTNPQASSAALPNAMTTPASTNPFQPAPTSAAPPMEVQSAETLKKPSPTSQEVPKPVDMGLKPAPSFSSQPPAKDKSSAINPSPLRFSTLASPNRSASSPAQSIRDLANAGTTFQTAPSPLFSQSAAAVPPPSQTVEVFKPVPKRDYMGDFTKWFLLGDNGLLDEFKIYMVDELLKPLHADFQRQQAEQREKEEEEANNAKADKWRVYNLRLKFFYRWKRNAREQRQRFLRRSGRDQMREFWQRAELEKKEKEKRAREEEDRRAAELAATDRPAEFREMLKKRRTSSRQTANELLASGVLSGIPNEREAIAGIVYSGANASLSPSVVDRSSRASSSNPARKEGAKTRALREELLGKPSRRSLPSVFSRDSASPSRTTSPAPTTSKVSERWRLKAMGFVQMPDGTILREDVANIYLNEGKSYPRLWASSSYGSASQEEGSKRASFGNSAGSGRLRASSQSTPSFGTSLHRPTLSVGQASHGKSVFEASPAKRKRGDKDVGGEENEASGDTPPHKRTVSDLLDMASKVRNEHKAIKEMLEDMLDKDKEYYREASEQLGSEAPSRSGTPWRASGGGLGV